MNKTIISGDKAYEVVSLSPNYINSLIKQLEKSKADLATIRGAVEGGAEHPWIPGAAMTDDVRAALLLPKKFENLVDRL
jgi:hypothetical protein